MHNHHCCQHQLAFCAHCNVVYCKTCKAEFVPRSYYPYYPYTYTITTPTITTGTGTTTSYDTNTGHNH